MALVYAESMDKYSVSSDFDIFNDNFSWSGDTGGNPGDMVASVGRFGGNAYQINTFTTPYKIRIPWNGFATGTTIVGGLAFRYGSTDTNNETIADFLVMTTDATGSLYHWQLCICGANNLVLLDETGAVVAVAANCFYSRVWHWLEFKFSMLDAGSYEIRIDGVTVMSGSGDFRDGNGNTSTLGHLRLNGSDSLTAGDGSMRYGDIVLMDGSGSAPYNDFLGDLRIECTIPNADGAVANWTSGNAGANYTNIDDALAAYNGDTGTDYISSNTDEQVNLAAHVDHSLTDVATIHFALLSLMAAKATSGKNVAPRVVSGATGADGATLTPLVDNYTWCNAFWTADPNTAAAWTKTNLNAAEWGVKTKA